MNEQDRPRRPWLLGALLALVTAGVVAAIATSEISGTGATNVGDSGGIGHAVLTDGALDGAGTPVLLVLGVAALGAVGWAHATRPRGRA